MAFAEKMRATAFVSLAAVSLTLAGCQVIEGPTPETPKRESIKKPKEAPQLVPGGTATQNLPFFQEVLRQYAASEQPIEGQPVVDALATAGFDKAAMQVSFDRSKTNLVADNIFVSVKIGEECLIGQLVTADRTAYAVTEPAIGPDKVCLVGKTRPIDW